MPESRDPRLMMPGLDGVTSAAGCALRERRSGVRHPATAKGTRRTSSMVSTPEPTITSSNRSTGRSAHGCRPTASSPPVDGGGPGARPEGHRASRRCRGSCRSAPASGCTTTATTGSRWRAISDHSDARFSHGICPDCYESVVKPQLQTLTQGEQDRLTDQSRARATVTMCASVVDVARGAAVVEHRSG